MAKTGSGKRQPVNPAQRGDKRRADFVRVVTPRVTKAIKAIGLIANCAGSNYIYTDLQTAQILGALGIAVDNVAGAFSKKVASESGFAFKADVPFKG